MFAHFSDAKIAHKFGDIMLNGGVEYRCGIKMVIFDQTHLLTDLLTYFCN